MSSQYRKILKSLRSLVLLYYYNFKKKLNKNKGGVQENLRIIISRDLFKENKELLLKVKKLVGEKAFDTLEELGRELIKDNEHPSFIMSYYIYRYSWPIPEELEKEIKDILDSVKND